MLLKHDGHLDTIVPRDKTFVLSEAFNLSRGGRLVSLEHEKDERLLRVFDRLSHAADFYYGRYDIRCTSIEDLKEGRNFAVLEFNGSGAEPHHIYGNGNSLFRAMKILVDHWGALYRISRANFERGVSPWSFERGYSFFIKSEEYITRLRQLDMEVNHEGEREEPAGSEATRAGLAPEVVVQGAGSLTKQRANGN